ncbi:hypothetical protein OROGR_029179 [Orobanche gracilis]
MARVRERIIRQETSSLVIFASIDMFDDTVEKSVNETRRHIIEVLGHGAPLGSSSWDWGDGASYPTEQTGGVPSPNRAPVPIEHISTLDHQSSVPTVTPPVIPAPPSLDHQSLVLTVTPPVIPVEMLVTPPVITPRTRPSSSTSDLILIPLGYSSIAIQANTYDSPKLYYRSYRPYSPFSTTVVRKRKDLDEEAYSRWLDSDKRKVSASWFLLLHDESKLIDTEHLYAYMGVLQFDPSFVVMRWLNEIGCPDSFGSYELLVLMLMMSIYWSATFTASDHFGAIIALGGNYVSVNHLEYVSKVLMETLGSSPHSIRAEYHHHAQFPARKDLFYLQDDSSSCGAFSIRMLESLVQQSISHGKIETDYEKQTNRTKKQQTAQNGSQPGPISAVFMAVFSSWCKATQISPASQTYTTRRKTRRYLSRILPRVV